MRIIENEPLALHTTWRVGGPARYFAEAVTDEEVREAVRLSQQEGLPFMVLGLGSNTLFPDAGYAGVVIHLSGRAMSREGLLVRADSGVPMKDLLRFALEQGLTGLEQIGGIPGTVGGAVRGNAGTWQTETKDYLSKVEVLDTNDSELQVRQWAAKECGFSYRHSRFKQERQFIVLRAIFELASGNVEEARRLTEEDLRKRHDRQPYEAPSAGSVFKNPDREHGVFAGALIEQCGLKGISIGKAEISLKHANFILNRGGATSADILALMRLIQDKVEQKFHIRLEPEVEVVASSGG